MNADVRLGIVSMTPVSGAVYAQLTNRSDVRVQMWVLRATGGIVGWAPTLGFLDDRDDFAGYSYQPCECDIDGDPGDDLSHYE